MNKPLRAGAPPRLDSRERIGAGARPDSVPAQLSGHAPLVPVHSAASRALVGVIAILTFLAALCAGAAALVASHSQEWQAAVGREATIQVRPNLQRNIEADMALVADL